MSRFEIEDIVSQDKKGIVFRAHDLDRGHTVALRRFFPFGQDGGGLNDDESAAFRVAAHRLLGVTHPSLRSVFSGAVDPIDEMPYIVAEWVDGAKLDDVLAGETLDPRLVIQLLRLALEVSLSLSEILGEEAVWVETEIDSIFVGSEESGRDFVFWLSPFKWLGAEFGSRKLTAVVNMGEHLAGWKGKFIGDHAGHGLGGWLKWMKTNPDASLAGALEALPAFINADETPPPPKPSFAAPFASGPAVRVKQPPSISPILIAACVGLLLAVGGLAYFRMSAKSPDAPPGFAAQTTSPSAAGPKPDQAKAVQPESAPTAAAEPPPGAAAPEPTPQPTGDTEARPLQQVQEMAEKLAREKEAQRTAALAPPVVSAPHVRDFIPGDSEKMRALKANGPASVTGVVRKVRNSNSGHSLYFEFSSPLQPQEIHVVAHKNNLEGEFKVEAYNHLIGKNLRFDGIVFREPTGRQYVKITTTKKITEAK
jgi:hypothetical protein